MGTDEKRRDLRLMCFAASIALLALLATPWLTVWSDHSVALPPVYSGVDLTGLLSIRESPLGGFAAWLFRSYLLFAVVCLVFPGTIAAVAGSCAGFAATVAIIMVKPDSHPASTELSVVNIEWTGASTVAVGLWLVVATVAVAGWSTAPRTVSARRGPSGAALP